MFAYQLISNEIFALKPSDSAANAFVFMEDWQVKDLPIVQNLKVIGMVNEQILLNNENENLVNVLNPTPIYCFENTHFYDVLKLIFNQINNFHNNIHKSVFCKTLIMTMIQWNNSNMTNSFLTFILQTHKI
jgi:signal-transduction protein with cAMP-binding, CBS, and nucleotidyltransferase domain